jgi:hypothetical protein
MVVEDQAGASAGVRPMRKGRGGWHIYRAGGWKSTRMPLQYAEKINAARSGMARAAAATGRDELVSEEG